MEVFEAIEEDLERDHTPEYLWNAPAHELLAAIEEQQGEIFSRSLIIAFCLRRLREMAE